MLPTIGYLDGYNPSTHSVSGWARRPDGKPVTLVASRAGDEVARTKTIRERRDLGMAGFILPLPKDVSVKLLLDGTIIVQDEEGTGRIPVWDPLRERLASYIDSVWPTERIPKEVTAVNVPVGWTSADRSVSFGRDGFVFILGGTNSVAAQYAQSSDDPQILDLARNWIRIMRDRDAAIAESGRQFVQLIIPEKSSLLPDLAPYKADYGTPLMHLIENMLHDGAGSHFFLDTHKILTAANPRQVFARANSHLTPRGAHAVFCAVLVHLGLAAPHDIPFSTTLIGFSDLSARFNGLALFDVDDAPSAEIVSMYDQTISIVPTSYPSKQAYDRIRHVGTGFTTKNPSAPLDLKIAVFGNSFTGEGPRGPATLGWWFSRWFREYTFLFSPNVYWETIATFGADIVVAQTIERFLVSLPDDHLGPMTI